MKIQISRAEGWKKGNLLIHIQNTAWCIYCSGVRKSQEIPAWGMRAGRTALTLIWDGSIQCRGRDKYALTCESHVIIPRILELILIMAPVPGTPPLGHSAANEAKQSRRH